jgi:hypothetical protein
MKDFFKKFAYISCFMFGVVFTLAVIPIGYVSYQILFGLPIQTVYSEKHTASLRQTFGVFDYNLLVEIDNQQVYNTGDMVGLPSQLRTTLVWDKTGKVVIFERMGKISFAYNAEEKRQIDNYELKNYCFSPMMENYRLQNKQICEEN